MEHCWESIPVHFLQWIMQNNLIRAFYHESGISVHTSNVTYPQVCPASLLLGGRFMLLLCFSHFLFTSLLLHHTAYVQTSCQAASSVHSGQTWLQWDKWSILTLTLEWLIPFIRGNYELNLLYTWTGMWYRTQSIYIKIGLWHCKITGAWKWKLNFNHVFLKTGVK